MWIDRHGRAVSPPLSSPSLDLDYHPSLRRTSSYRGAHETQSSFRKVMMVRERGRPLGLLIRGGVERGLGIYVCGVEERSSGDYAGLQVGDQILSVNDRDFTSITREEALGILERSPRMSIVLRWVGKMPRSPLMPSVTSGMPTLPTLPSYESDEGPSPSPPPHSSLKPSPSPAWYAEPVHQRRPSVSRKRSPRNKKSEEVPSEDLDGFEARSERRESQSGSAKKPLLSENQRVSLAFYCGEYEAGAMGVEELVSLVLEILDTAEKFTLMTEVRALIRDADLEKFDDCVYRREISSTKRKGSLKISVEVHAESSDGHSISPAEAPKRGISPRTSLRASTRRRHSQQQQQQQQQHLSHHKSPQGVRLLSVPTTHPSESPSEDSGVELANGQLYALLGSRRGSRVSTSSRDSVLLEQMQSKGTWRSTPRGANAPRRSLDASTFTSASREGNEATRIRRATLRRHSSGGEGVNPEDRRKLAYYKTYEDRRWSTGSETPDDHEEGHLDAVQQAVLSRLEAIALTRRRHSLNPPRTNLRLSPIMPPSSPPVLPISPGGLQVPHIRVRRHRSLPDPVAIMARKRAQQLEQHHQHRTASVRIPGHRTIPEGNGRLRVIVKKTRPILGIAIEGGVDTTHELPRIISIHSSGAAFDAGGLKVGHLILEVEGQGMEGLPHREIAQMIAHAFYSAGRDQIEMLVAEGPNFANMATGTSAFTSSAAEDIRRRASLFCE